MVTSHIYSMVDIDWILIGQLYLHLIRYRHFDIKHMYRMYGSICIPCMVYTSLVTGT